MMERREAHSSSTIFLLVPGRGGNKEICFRSCRPIDVGGKKERKPNVSSSSRVHLRTNQEKEGKKGEMKHIT